MIPLARYLVLLGVPFTVLALCLDAEDREFGWSVVGFGGVCAVWGGVAVGAWRGRRVRA